MSNHDPKRERRRVEREAICWYRRLQDPDLPVSEWDRWLLWHAVPAHRETFESIASVWERLHGELSPPDASASAPQRPHNRLPKVLARAVIALFIMVLLGPGPSSRSPITVLQTDADTPAALMLNDGSTVRVAPDTRLEIANDLHYRSAYLVRGQAFFDVVKDPIRPFVVRTNLAVATALGTRFVVSRTEKESVVTVMEGTVAVSPASSQKLSSQSASSPIKLNAREQIRVLPAGVQSLQHLDSNLELDWATTIQFKQDPIIEAIKKFNERNTVRLELVDPRAARDVHLSGGFQLDQPESFAQIVADKTSAPVLVHRPGSAPLTVNPRTLQLHDDAQRNNPAAR